MGSLGFAIDTSLDYRAASVTVTRPTNGSKVGGVYEQGTPTAVGVGSYHVVDVAEEVQRSWQGREVAEGLLLIRNAGAGYTEQPGDIATFNSTAYEVHTVRHYSETTQLVVVRFRTEPPRG